MSVGSIENRRKLIEDRIEKIFADKNKSDLLALDFEINLLVCAAQSYKHETVLKPFPSTLLSDSNNEKNYKQLLNALWSLPPVLEWRTKMKKFDQDQLAIVYWILFHKSFRLEYSDTIDQDQLKEMAKYTHEFSKPSHIFEIKYNEEKNKKFDLLKKQTSEELATENSLTSINFHGTRMDNIYSILHTGLLGHMNKNSLYGEGTYLSQEPSVSLHYSPSCKTWDKSLIGQRMSCVLVCESINDPKHVKIGINESTSQLSSLNKNNENSNSTSKLASDVSTSGDKTIPDKYFIVKNNDYVRIRYVLLYSEKTQVKRKNKFIQFLNENRFAILLMCYSLLLIFIGLMNSRAFHKYVKLSYKKLSNYLLGDASSSSPSTAYD